MIGRVIAAYCVNTSQDGAFDALAAEQLGVSLTDLRCLDIVESRGGLTAGELATASGLTTGAVTAVVDRLERAGLARRIRDELDRRKGSDRGHAAPLRRVRGGLAPAARGLAPPAGQAVHRCRARDHCRVPRALDRSRCPACRAASRVSLAPVALPGEPSCGVPPAPLAGLPYCRRVGQSSVWWSRSVSVR
ncbi:MAG: MarR family transcriptional regulator [Actinobacteria bacterium]|nr:MarR family transcriptional regulator [Actinomycetota bacterium]